MFLTNLSQSVSQEKSNLKQEPFGKVLKQKYFSQSLFPWILTRLLTILNLEQPRQVLKTTNNTLKYNSYWGLMRYSKADLGLLQHPRWSTLG